MLPFYLMLILPLSVYAYVSRTKRCAYADNAAIKCFFIILFLLLALRSETVGIDVQAYKYYFQSISELGWDRIFSYNLEAGYILLNKIISVFTQNYNIFLAVVAAICVYPIYLVYKQNIENAGISIVIFINMSMFVMMFSGLRQSIAIALGMLAFICVQKKRWILFILITAIAITFHQSAFMILFMYPAYYYHLTKKSLYFIIPTIIITLIFNKEIFYLLLQILPQKYNDISLIGETGAYTMILLLIIFILYAFIIPDESILDQNTIGLRNFLVLSLFIQIFAPIHATAMRMNYYYLVFIPLLIPKIMIKGKENWKNTVELSKIVILLFFTAFFFYHAYTSTNNLNVFPYHFFWENI